MNRFFETIKQIPLKVLILGFSLNIAAAIFSVGFLHPDEHFQIMEFANLKTGLNNPEDLAWEYNARLRSSIQPTIAYLVIEACDTIGISNPFSQSTVLRIISSLLGFMVMLLLIHTFKDQLETEIFRKWFFYLSLLLWFLIFIHVRFSSENWTGIFFFAGIAIYLISAKKLNRLALLSGVLLGLSFLFRFQSGIMIVSFFFWLLFINKESFKNLFLLLIGICIIILVGVVLDRFFYGEWTFPAWNYFVINIIENKAAQFGEQPWWFYFSEILKFGTYPIGLIVLISALIFAVTYPKHILNWIIIPFFLIHIFIGHKELRFLFPIANAIPIVLIISTPKIFDLIKKLKQNINHRFLLRWIVYPLWILNLSVALFASLKPVDSYVPLYSHLYEEYQDDNILLLYSGVNPYGRYKEPMKFYTPKGLKTLQSEKPAMIESVLKSEEYKDYKILYITNSFFLEEEYEKLNVEFDRSYLSLPEWVVNINFNNWLERTEVFNLYKLSIRN
jgi:phosphatidylinositol glycan class B